MIINGNTPLVNTKKSNGAPSTHPIHGHEPADVSPSVSSNKAQPEGLRASQMLSGQNVSVSLRRKFNLGDYESLDIEYHLGGQLPDEVDPLWALDDLTDELRQKVEAGAGPEIATREAIAKESFLTTPRNEQKRIIRLYLEEQIGKDQVDAFGELLLMGVDLRDVLKERKAVANVNGNGVHA